MHRIACFVPPHCGHPRPRPRACLRVSCAILPRHLPSVFCNTSTQHYSTVPGAVPCFPATLKIHTQRFLAFTLTHKPTRLPSLPPPFLRVCGSRLLCQSVANLYSSQTTWRKGLLTALRQRPRIKPRRPNESSPLLSNKKVDGRTPAIAVVVIQDTTESL